MPLLISQTISGNSAGLLHPKENLGISASHGHLSLNHHSRAEPGLQKHHCLAEGQGPKRAGSPEYYCFHALYRWMPGNLSIIPMAS